MLNNGLDAASAAFEVGYESATQFNREYSRFFGQPPMRDIRALLSSGAPKLELVGSRGEWGHGHGQESGAGGGT